MIHKKTGRKIASGYRKALGGLRGSKAGTKLRESKVGGWIRKAAGQKPIPKRASNGQTRETERAAKTRRGTPRSRTAEFPKDTHGKKFAPNVISGGSKLSKKRGVWR